MEGQEITDPEQIKNKTEIFLKELGSRKGKREISHKQDTSRPKGTGDMVSLNQVIRLEDCRKTNKLTIGKSLGVDNIPNEFISLTKIFNGMNTRGMV